ncbi:MAG: hypothetical protein RL757_1377 [Bacteroidota bacterium]|jgi:3-dehydroquinate synthase
MQKIDLADYSIFIGNDWNEWNIFLQQYQKIVVLCDGNTEKFCFEPFSNHFPAHKTSRIRIGAGETFKNLETCQHIWQQLFELQADRNTLLINLGGGVIGDMGGFCAATFKRGMPFLQLPTTLLSQVDASIGGKLGIDFGGVKNSIGVFQNPKAVFVFPQFLKTLSAAELRSGFAEIVKHALIADKNQWNAIKNLENLKNIDFSTFLKHSLEIKKRIVEIDPFEKGLRKALNFGHTIGHAVESLALESPKPLLHGEAVAIGMICETWLSHKILGLPKEEVTAVTNFILKIYGKNDINFNNNALLALMQQDKKNEAARINFSLLPALGAVEINQTPPPQYIIESLDFYRGLN